MLNRSVFIDEEKKPQAVTNGIFYAPIAWLGLCSFYLLLLALDEYAVSKWGANIPSTVTANGGKSELKRLSPWLTVMENSDKIANLLINNLFLD